MPDHDQIKIVRLPDLRAGMLVVYHWWGQWPAPVVSLGLVEERTPTAPNAKPGLFLTHLTTDEASTLGCGLSIWTGPDATIGDGRSWSGLWIPTHLQRADKPFLLLAESVDARRDRSNNGVASLLPDSVFLRGLAERSMLRALGSLLPPEDDR